MADQPPPPSSSDNVPTVEAHIQPRIEVDPSLTSDDASDTASSLGSSYATSMNESILDYRKLHGRTYENFKDEDRYWAPNDDQQNEGLDIIHNALLMLLEDKLCLAPVGHSPERVLDIGTGTGIWPLDFAEQCPESKVYGTDLSPIQPSWVPKNVEFVLEDCMQEWTFPPNYFDFVHIRALYGSIPDWVTLYEKAFRSLKPGGWIQDLEMDVALQSDHVPIPEDHVFSRWGNVFVSGGEKMGRSFSVARGRTMRDNMLAAGFVDVVEHKIRAPMHGWPADPRLRQAGLLFQVALDTSLEGLGIFLMTQVLGWDEESVTALCHEFRRELNRKSNCAWCSTTIVYGRKPLEPTGKESWEGVQD